MAEPSAITACALRTEVGNSAAMPTGGFARISAIIAKSNGPGPEKTSPASRLGVITLSSGLSAKVFSSK